MLLPLVIAFVILVPCIIYSFEIIPSNLALLLTPFVLKKDLINKKIIIMDNNTQVSISFYSNYSNLQENSTLISVKKDLEKVPGIYAIIHNDSNKLYIGSSINLSLRLINHLKNRSSNIYLQHVIAKYRLSNFSIIILEILPINDISEENLMIELIKLEQKYLDLFDNKYNINPIAGKSRVGAKHTEASKELMSKLRRKNP